MKITEKYVFFYKSWLSQWNYSDFVLEGITFPYAEKWMMWSKAKLFNDQESMKKILAATHPKIDQDLGRHVSGYNQKLWDANKYEIVKSGNLARFSQNEELMRRLLSFGDRKFVEVSPIDKVWGIGLSEDDPLIEDENNWLGQNLLGEVLTEVRDILARNNPVSSNGK